MPTKPEPHVGSHRCDLGSSSSRLRVLAVSRAQPASQLIHSQQTLTAIVRAPSSTPLVLAPETGIEGHKSAIHDAQVYAFFAHHYDYWTSRLKIERSKWDWAFWGENLTVRVPDGVDEQSVNLGDRWVFSSCLSREENNQGLNDVSHDHQDSQEKEEEEGVILEVCGGRNPCSRLAWRCGQPSSWLAEVAKTGYCGVYLRIVRAGSITPGDTARIIPADSAHTVPAASIARCAFSPLADPATRTLALRILRVPALQNMNRQIIMRKLAMMEEGEAARRNRWDGWRSLKIIRVVDESPSIKSFYFAAADGQPLASYVPGQFLTIKLPSGQVRCWSISSWSPSAITSLPQFYRITIKKGLSASLDLYSHFSTGDRLLTRSPSGSFVPDWIREFPARQIYISAGIGMTPTLSMLQAHFAHPTLVNTPAIVIHVARNSEQDIPMFKAEMPVSPLLRTFKFYTSPIAGVDVQGRDFDHAGRPMLDFLATLLAQPYHIDPLGIAPIELAGNASNAYVCGPPDFVVTIRKYLEQSKVPPQAIRQGTFSYDTSFFPESDNISSANASDRDAPEVSIVRFREKEAKWKRSEGLSLLQLIEREGGGERPESGCRMGDCGACEMMILKGEAQVSKSAGKEAQEASGRAGTIIRSCCSFPATDLLELDF